MDASWAYQTTKSQPIKPCSRELTSETIQRADEDVFKNFC